MMRTTSGGGPWSRRVLRHARTFLKGGRAGGQGQYLTRLVAQYPAILDIAPPLSLNILSEYPAILDITTYVSLNKLFGYLKQASPHTSTKRGRPDGTLSLAQRGEHYVAQPSWVHRRPCHACGAARCHSTATRPSRSHRVALFRLSVDVERRPRRTPAGAPR